MNRIGPSDPSAWALAGNHGSAGLVPFPFPRPRGGTERGAPEAPAREAAPVAGLRPLDPTEDPEWDAGLSACPQATFFHGSAWAAVLRDTYGFRPRYFVTREAGRMAALLPVMEVDSWLTGKRGVALPFTDACGPIGGDPAACRRLCAEARQHGQARRWRYLEIRGGRELLGNPPASASFHVHRLDLGRGEAALFGGVDGSVRRAVRKAEKSGLTVEFSRELEDVRAFFLLLRQTRKRHGVPPQPFRFFREIHRHILSRNQGWVVLARAGGVPVAGAVFFLFGKTVTYKYAASDTAFQHLRANNLVLWRAISRFAREGFEMLDLGRTALDNEGLRNYKLGWGASEQQLDYVRLGGRGPAAPGRGLSRHCARLCRILPDPLLGLIGAALHKHVA